MKKYFATILLLVSITTLASAQVLIEDFSYTAGDTLGKYWAWHSGTAGQDTIQSAGLTYTGYASSGIGNSVKINTGGTEDLHKNFPDSIKSGTVYASFLVNVASVNTTGDYFFHFGEGPFNTGHFDGRVSVKSNAGGSLAFGLSKAQSIGSATFTPFNYSKNTTYLLVLKYMFVPNTATDDSVALYIFTDPTLPSTEPATATIGPIDDASGADLLNVGAVAIRQGSAANVQTMQIDGIRVDRTWNGIFFSTFVSKTAISFGNVNVATSSVDSFYVKNIAATPLSIASVNSSDPLFAVLPTSATIAASDSQWFYVTFAPTNTVASSATISITPTGSTSSMIVGVSGSGVQAGFTATPTSISFGNVFKDSTETDTVTVSNSSTTLSLVIDSVRSSNSSFAVTPISGTVGISSSAKFAVSFLPTAKGAVSAKIIFYHNAPSHQDTVKVTGNGILKEPLFTATPAGINFGAILVGGTRKDSVTVKNTGYDSLIISSAQTGDASLVLTPTTARLDTGASAKFYVTYTAGAAGYKAGSIVFMDNTSEAQDTVFLKAKVLTPVSISEARKDVNADFVPDYSISLDTLAITGVITTPNMGASASQTSYFIQDATGGMDAFAFGLVSTTYARGDSILVIGQVKQFNGLDEFTPIAWNDSYVKFLAHVAIPAPIHLTFQQFTANAESYEGQLVELDTLYKKSGTWPASPANVSIYLTNSAKTDSIQMFLDLDANITGTAQKPYPINVVGIVSQFSTVVPPNKGYEISPRDSLDIVHTPGTAGVAENEATTVPKTFELFNSYPNPFNPSTTIEYGLPQQSKVTLKVYSVLGQEIMTLVNDVQGASYHKVQWNGRDNNGLQVSSGVYFFRIVAQPLDGKTAPFTQVRKMMLMK